MLSKNLKYLRNEIGLSQKKLSDNLNVSQTSIAKWEQGKSEATEENIVKIATFFNVTSDYLLGLEDDFGVKINEQKGREKKLEDMELLTQIYLKLNERLKAKLMGYALGLAEQQK